MCCKEFKEKFVCWIVKFKHIIFLVIGISPGLHISTGFGLENSSVLTSLIAIVIMAASHLPITAC